MDKTGEFKAESCTRISHGDIGEAHTYLARVRDGGVITHAVACHDREAAIRECIKLYGRFSKINVQCEIVPHYTYHVWE